MSILEILEKYQKQVPVDIFRLINELDMGPQFKPLDDDISGWIEKTDNDKYHIVINANHAMTRKRFTAAHELAHYIYHRNLLGDGVGDTRAYRSAKSPRPNSNINASHEREANNFAANILMPRDEVNLQKQNYSQINDQTALELAEKFNVSLAAMKIRLGIL